MPTTDQGYQVHPDHSIQSLARDGLPVRLGGRGFVMDLTGFQRLTIQAQRQLVDDGAEVGDRTLNGQGTWKRTQQSFHHGAGQSFWDENEDTDREQYDWSFGIDPWDPRELKLHHDVTEVHDSTQASMVATRMLACGDYLYAVGDGKVHWSNTPDVDDSWTTFALVGAHWLAWDGESIYVSTATNTYKFTPGAADPTVDGVWAAYNRVWFSSGKIIASNLTSIATLDTDGVLVPSTNLPAPPGTHITNSFRLGGSTYVITQAISGIDHSIVYRLVVNDAADFDSMEPVLETPIGEEIGSALNMGDRAVVGSNIGLRLIEPAGGEQLNYGLAVPVAPTPDYMDSFQLEGMTSEGRFVWGTVTRPTDNAGFIGLVRFDIGTFTTENVPSYAADLGIDVGDVGLPVESNSVARFGGKTYIGTNIGIYVETDEYVETGILHTGLINFSTPEKKAFTSLNVRTKPLPDGASIRCWASNAERSAEHGIFLMTGNGVNNITENIGSPGQVPVEEDTELIFELNRPTVTTDTPNLTRWTLRALPVPFRAESITLPIVVSPAVQDLPGQSAVMDTHGDWEYLHQLHSTREIVPLQLGDETIMVYVDAVEIDQARASAGLRDWSMNRTSFIGTWAVTVITTDADPSTEPERLLGQVVQ